MPTVAEVRGTLREALATAQAALNSASDGEREAAQRFVQTNTQALQRFETANQGRGDGDDAVEPAGGPAASQGGRGGLGGAGSEVRAANAVAAGGAGGGANQGAAGESQGAGAMATSATARAMTEAEVLSEVGRLLRTGQGQGIVDAATRILELTRPNTRGGV